MNSRYPHLISPMKVGNTYYKNRIISCPMTLHSLQGTELYPTEAVMQHFVNKAKGGAAVVTVASVSAKPDVADGIHANYSPYETESQRYLSQLVDQIHYYGAKASAQISLPPTVTKSAASAGQPLFIEEGFSEEMQEDEMRQITGWYADAALQLKNIGFDVIMLHFGHGNMFAQFMSPAYNNRTDKYGGSIENRARFPLMILKAVRENVGRNTVIELRLSGKEFEENGLTTEECIEFIKLYQEYIDIVQVSAGTHIPRWMTRVHPTSLLPHMPNAQFARAVKACPDIRIPVEAIGGIQELESAEALIAEGGADFVAIARGIIADPELPLKAYEGRGEDVVPCIKCLHCHDSVMYTSHYVCAVNPRIGFEHKTLTPPEEKRKKVVVVGGGPAGMQAALTAAENGHEVTLYEKSSSLGGQLSFSDFVSFKYDLRRFKDYLIAQVMKSSIDVRLNTEAAPELISKLGADAVIAAIGAKPVMPPIPGIDSDNVMLAVDVYGNDSGVGKNVAIIGGGQIGCETAIHLAELGRSVTVLEMQGELAPDAFHTYREAMLFRMEDLGIADITGARCTDIAEGIITYVDEGGSEKSIEADTILVAAGMYGLTDDAMLYFGTADRHYMAGDCRSRAADVEKAIRTGYAAGANV